MYLQRKNLASEIPKVLPLGDCPWAECGVTPGKKVG